MKDDLKRSSSAIPSGIACGVYSYKLAPDFVCGNTVALLIADKKKFLEINLFCGNDILQIFYLCSGASVDFGKVISYAERVDAFEYAVARSCAVYEHRHLF